MTDDQETEVIVGWFSFPCQSDGWCTYGCGIRPATLCESCAILGGEKDLSNWHPMTAHCPECYDYEYTDICDRCQEAF